jgi:hypothetical protein
MHVEATNLVIKGIDASSAVASLDQYFQRQVMQDARRQRRIAPKALDKFKT